MKLVCITYNKQQDNHYVDTAPSKGRGGKGKATSHDKTTMASTSSIVLQQSFRFTFLNRIAGVTTNFGWTDNLGIYHERSELAVLPSSFFTDACIKSARKAIALETENL